MSFFIPPDWRDADAYPAKTDEWLLGQWVWAFLRRNPDYQNDYTHFESLPSYYANGAETSKWGTRATQEYGAAELRFCKQPILPGEAVVEYVARTGDQTPYDCSLEAHLTEKWGIISLADPSNDEGSYCIVFEVTLPKIIEEKYRFDPEIGDLAPTEPEPEEFHEMTLRFDLRYSIDTQLYHAKDYLIERKKALKEGILPIEEIRKRGINRNFLPKYLRAYDAYLAGATNLEIAKYLWPERKIQINKSKYDANNSKDANEQLAQRAATKGIELVMGGYKEFLRIV